MVRGSLLGVLGCVGGVVSGIPGVVEAVVYGSLVRGDFVDGCSDLDIFLVVSEPFLDAHSVSRLVGACLDAHGLRVRGVDVAWCYYDELLSHRCDYKFLTVYRGDFELNSVLVHGRPVHRVQAPVWSPLERCRRLLELSRRPHMRGIVAGETVKLRLALEGYVGPWDKWSVLEAARSLGGCYYEVWSAYVSCGRPSDRCVGRVLGWLVRLCGAGWWRGPY